MTLPVFAPPVVGYNTVLDDTDRAEHGRFWDPTAKKSRALPEPYRLTSDKGYSNVELDDAAVNYVAVANDQSIEKVHYVLRKESGIVNFGYAAYTAQLVNGKIRFTWASDARPKFEYVVFGGAVVFVHRIDRNRCYVTMLEVGGVMPAGKFFPPIQRFRSIDQFDVLATLPYNAVMFSRKGDSCWIDKSHLRPLFPAPPTIPTFTTLALTVDPNGNANVN